MRIIMLMRVHIKMQTLLIHKGQKYVIERSVWALAIMGL